MPTSGVGTDIKEALVDVGNSITIAKSGEVITSGEYVMSKANSQVTKPFIREFFLETTFPYDTSGEVGDRITFVTTQEPFLLMNRTPVLFDDEKIKYDTVMYKCNVSGELLRATYSVRDNQLRLRENFVAVSQNVYALLTEPLFGASLDADDELGQLGLKREELYIPSHYGIRVLDSYSPVSGEYFKVETIQKRRYPGVDVVTLSEDTRI